MSWLDVISLATRSLGRRPARAALTAVAVALGAALFAALVTIAGTARSRVLEQLTKGGPLAGIHVAAAANEPSEEGDDDARPGPPRDLDDAVVGEIAALPHVRGVVPIESTPVVVVPPDPVTLPDGSAAHPTRSRRRGPPGTLAETLVGIDLSRASELPISLLAGRLPAPGSRVEVVVTPGWLAHYGLARTDADAMVGHEVAVGAPRSFGQAIRARWTRARVVGVVAQEAAPGGLLASIDQVSLARGWTGSGQEDERIERPSSQYVGAYVVAEGLDRVAAVRSGIADIGYSTRAPENLIASVQRYLRVVEVVLTGVGAIALGIAALGVSNALAAAVRERRREIGVLKAIGARDGDVLRLFLVEAAVLGLVGGLIGTVVGLGLAGIIAAVVNDYLHSQGLMGIEAQFPGLVLLAGVAGSGILSVLAGAVPALRAAHLPAREAVDA